MGSITVRFLKESDIDKVKHIVISAWEYYLQEINPDRVSAMLSDRLDNPACKLLVAFENEEAVGIAEFMIMESYRYDGEEARLELLFIKDTSSNYYDAHSALMNGIFEFLREEKIEFLRIDTTLENADVLIV